LDDAIGAAEHVQHVLHRRAEADEHLRDVELVASESFGSSRTRRRNLSWWLNLMLTNPPTPAAQRRRGNIGCRRCESSDWYRGGWQDHRGSEHCEYDRDVHHKKRDCIATGNTSGSVVRPPVK
jgi:hypothetical protein